MGKKALFFVIAVNALLIAFSALNRPATASSVAMAVCCQGGQCVQAPIWQCWSSPSCSGNGDCELPE